MLLLGLRMQSQPLVSGRAESVSGWVQQHSERRELAGIIIGDDMRM